MKGDALANMLQDRRILVIIVAVIVIIAAAAAGAEAGAEIFIVSKENQNEALLSGKGEVFAVSSLKEDTPAFAELISDSAQTVVELFKEFKNFKKSLNELKNVVVKLNDLEEQGDRLYLEAMRKLAKEAADTRELIEWRSVYSSLERCMDAAESIADDIELVVMKNI